MEQKLHDILIEIKIDESLSIPREYLLRILPKAFPYPERIYPDKTHKKWYCRETLINRISKQLRAKGMVRIQDYDFLPQKSLQNLVRKIEEEKEGSILFNIERSIIYLLSAVLRKFKQRVLTRCLLINMDEYQKKFEHLSFEQFIEKCIEMNLIEHHFYPTKGYYSIPYVHNILASYLKNQIKNGKFLF
jgi:hypothetical protein